MKVYKVTEDFPQKEIYGLSSQMMRCAVSITSNIAEGFSRKTNKEKTQFYYMSLGSLTGLQNQLIIARDLKYLDKESFAKIAESTVIVQKLVHGLVKSSKILNTKY